jgi:hypothetical protein
VANKASCSPQFGQGTALVFGRTSLRPSRRMPRPGVRFTGPIARSSQCPMICSTSYPPIDFMQAGQPAAAPCPISTVGSPLTIVFGGGNGMIAPGSMTISPIQAAGLPPIRVTPVPLGGPGVVTPGPWGVPLHAGGGAFGMGHVCWSVMRHAG